MANPNQRQSASTGATIESQLTEEDVAAFLAAPLSAESQAGSIPAGEVTSNVQQRDLAANVDDPFMNQFLNYPPMFQGLAISNEYHTSGQAAERARTETDRGILPLRIDPTINSHEAWNSRYLQHQAVVPNGHWEQVVSPAQISMPEQPMGIMAHQIPPTNASLVNIQRGKAVVPESSSARVPPNLFLNIGNQNHVSPFTISSVTPPNMIPMQNQSQNLQIGKGRGGQSWDGRLLQIGKGSSSKRHKPNSPPNTGLELRLPNSAPENQVVQNQNNKPLTLEDLMSKSLYDPGYEALGLAVDPHIRMFLAQNAPSQKGYHKFK